jgi:hypothetical protein
MAVKKSETRQRVTYVRARCTEEEKAIIEAAAEAEGISVGAFIRARTLGDPGKRSRRRPPADRAELVKILAELGKIGSNINQIARRINSGDRVAGHVVEGALKMVSETLSLVRKTVTK